MLAESFLFLPDEKTKFSIENTEKWKNEKNKKKEERKREPH